MAAEDFFESEVAVVAAATAAVLSPRVRGVLRQGLVYGLAGVTAAGRAVAGAAQTVGRTVSDTLPTGRGAGSNGRAAAAVVVPARTPAASRPRTPRRTSAAATRAKAATTARPAAKPDAAAGP